MKINPISLSKINQNNSFRNKQIFKTNPLAMDTFQKSEVSFKGTKETSDDVFGKITDNLKYFPPEILQELSDMMIDDLVTGNFQNIPIEILNPFGNDGIYSLLDGLSQTIRDFSDLVEYERMEQQVQYLLDAYSDKKIRTSLKQIRTQKLENHLQGALRLNTPDDREFIMTLFKSSGFKNVANLENFSHIYSRNPKPFTGQAIEAIEIYGILKSKDDLANFGDILVYLFNEEYSKEVADYEVLNRTTAFLKQIGLQNFDKFDEKFGHLKDKFNGFEDISDKADAIVYAQETYADKTRLLDEILKQSSSSKVQDAERVYSTINDVVDYFYEQNDGKSLDGLSDVIEYATSSNKFKNLGLKQVAPAFNDFETPEDKVDFYLFLKDCEVSTSDFNVLVGKSIISDLEPLAPLVNKTELTDIISQIKGLKSADSADFYKKFRDVINATYDEQTESTEGVKSLISVIDRFKIKDSNSFLEFYNKANGVKKQNITKSEINDFLELFKYIDSPTLIDDARKQNTTAVKLLTQERDKFQSFEKEIQDYIINDEKSYFAGETPLSIYKKYREVLLKNPFDIKTVLQNVAVFDLANQKDYAVKVVQIGKFAKFFEDKQSLSKFFVQNNITFDGSDEDNQRIGNCFSIFDSLYDDENKDKSLQRITYFAESGFISKSESRLTELLEKMPDLETKRKVLSLIADKKIPSISQMEKFFKQYRINNTEGEKLISYLESTPDDVDFAENIRILNQVQEQINKLCVPARLTGDNIVSVDVSKFKNATSISTSDIVDILDGIYGASEDRNFLGIMSISKENNVKEVNSFRIAKEIALRVGKTEESYQNIVRLLNIDKESLRLDPNCSSYVYIRAIQDCLPKEFIEFVRSNDWIQYDKNGNEIPALGLHARLRTIDRFALNGVNDINELYTQETKEKLTSLLSTVYTKTPTEVRGSSFDKKIIADFNHNGKEIEVVFTQGGKMVTIVPRRKTA